MVVYPVVPKGMIILRLIPTAAHTLEDVKYTIECFSKIVDKLKSWRIYVRQDCRNLIGLQTINKNTGYSTRIFFAISFSIALKYL